MKNRLLRTLLLAAWSPALALAGILCIWGLLERKADIVKPIVASLAFLGRQMILDPKHYRLEVWTVCYEAFLSIELKLSMILILLIGPNLISQDLRFNALPLYFSRPLRRIDYFLGKLGIIAAFLCAVVVLPSIIAWILGLLFSLDITLIRDTYRLLFSSIVYGLIIAVSAGLLVLALSSLSRNSRYIALFWLGIWFVSGILSGILQDAARHEHRQEFYASQSIVRPNEQLRRQLRMTSAWDEFQKEELERSKTDWRPVVSYTGNLSRIGEHLLGSNKAWESLATIRPYGERTQFLSIWLGPQYPWYWSAGVLVALFGLSACILNFRVKSLDRLK
jgi:ABC-2 type transport system permease protein